VGVPGIEVEGFRIVVNTRDERGHRPHVHVIRSGTKCKILLDETLTPYDIVGMSKSHVRRAQELVAERFGKFVADWEKYNGTRS
jgi:hypothetical protein